ncbi:MAG: selenocysteine-specific translation elongation factor [Nitrospirae bacterium GWD2_57_9]|nr:MAG: selenocysteine-specific translation elongation factor [Nitrospirae bacterium GWD2_57_9]OGW47953.1 MAG: selenocysteine-specific translation elongation factor [Nitrospirae bacterium GWC2_57_9]
MKYIILGTAGHIDHGKSSLVKALTGTDPDRLKEEKERGITLDLGFASLDLPGGNRLGIVDVPGHEGLIKNMLAGVGGIDIVMLVIAADEGIMPQTREHLAICDLLHVKKGLIVLTKTDAVDKDWLTLVQDEVRDFVKGTFLEKSPIAAVSSKTGENLPGLIQELAKLSNEVSPKSSSGILRLPIDRVFTMKGFGTVITGTLLSGTISTEQEVEILPKTIRTKVRGIQSHNKAVTRSVAGQRTAVNLQNVEKDQLSRGDIIVSAGFFTPTKTLDAQLGLLKQAPRGLKTGARIRFYNATQEAIGRITILGQNQLDPGQEAFVQLRLEQPVIVQNGDRFILRFYSPMETLGGGMVLNPHPRRHKHATMQESQKNLGILEKGDLEARIGLLVALKGLAGMEENGIIASIAADKQDVASALTSLAQKKHLLRVDNLYVHTSHLAGLEKKTLDMVKQYHQDNPLKPGLDKEELKSALRMRLSPKVLNLTIDGLVKRKQLEAEGSKLRVPGFKAARGSVNDEVKNRIVEAIKTGGSQPPVREELPGLFGITEKDAKDLMKLLADEGRTVRINDSLHLDREILEKVREDLKKHLTEKKEITMAEFRDLAKTSRKYAVPIMEYFDSQKLTQRIGDKRVLRG